MDSKHIEKYYDDCHKDYKRVWHLDRCMAMHMGFWDDKTTRLRNALIRENEVLAEQAGVTSNDRVLDAGCGVGGSAIFLAAKYGCNVTGITLSTQQVRYANDYAEHHHVGGLTAFIVADYTKTPFPENSFDLVWAIESVCHAKDKNDFLREAYLLLKKGGRIIIADFFQSKHSMKKEESALLRKSFSGWAFAPEIDTVFHEGLKEQNFRNITEWDGTSLVYKPSKRLYLCSFPAFIVDWLERILKKRGFMEKDNVIAAHYQFVGLKKGLWKYKIFHAEK